jgi:hypothetical protein
MYGTINVKFIVRIRVFSCFGDIHSYWQTFRCCLFSQPVFKSVIFFLWLPKLGRKAENGCILISRTGVWSVEFVTPTIRRLMWLSDWLYHTRFAMVTRFLRLRRRRFVCEWRHNLGFHVWHGYRVGIVNMLTPRSSWDNSEMFPPNV